MGRSVTGSSATTTDVGVASTSWTRAPATDARGIIDTMNVASTTDQRICVR